MKVGIRPKPDKICFDFNNQYKRIRNLANVGMTLSVMYICGNCRGLSSNDFTTPDQFENVHLCPLLCVLGLIDTVSLMTYTNIQENIRRNKNVGSALKRRFDVKWCFYYIVCLLGCNQENQDTISNEIPHKIFRKLKTWSCHAAKFELFNP